MRILYLLLFVLLYGCSTPIRIVETYVTDSATGNTTKVVQKFYDSVDRYHHQSDYSDFMFRPYMYYDPFFYDPFWGSRRFYTPPRVIVPVRPITRPRTGYVAPRSDNKKSYDPPRPLPPGPRGTHVPGGVRSFSPPSGPKPLERSQAPSKNSSKPDNEHR